VKQAVEVLVLCVYCNLCMYFAQRPIFEHSVSGVGNLPSHVIMYGRLIILSMYLIVHTCYHVRCTGYFLLPLE